MDEDSATLKLGILATNPMTLTYELTQADYVDAQIMHRWRRYKPSTTEVWMRFTPIAGFGLILLGLFFYVRDMSLWAVWVEGLIGVYLIGGMPLAKFRLGRRYNRTRTHVGPVTLRFEEDAIYSECPGVASSRIEYTIIRSLYPAKNSILVYLAPAIFLILPRHVMTEVQQTDLLRFLQVKMGLTPEA
jgi:hypothetical protein